MSSEKPIKNWRNEELLEWIESVKIAPKPKEVLIKKIKEYKIDGSILVLCTSSDDVLTNLNLDHPVQAQVLWNQLILLPNFDNNNNNNSNNNKINKKEGESENENENENKKESESENENENENKSEKKSIKNLRKQSLFVHSESENESENENEKKREKKKQQQQQQQQQAKKAKSLFLNNNSNNNSYYNNNNNIINRRHNNKENIEFCPTIYLNGKSTTKNYKINSSWTVERLSQEIQNKETGISNDEALGERFVKLDLTAGNKPMSDLNKKLWEYGLVSSYVTIVVVARLKGGAQVEKKEQKIQQRIRRININNPLITVTNKPDSITYDDSEDEIRALMPCGHSFSAITMYTYIRHCFKTDLQITEFWCPVENCLYKKPWEWSLVAAIADLSMGKFQIYSDLLTEHSALKNEIKLCPRCKTVISKPEQISQNRVACTNCEVKRNGGDFCYSCLKLWIGDGFQICGNKKCDTNLIIETLANCEITKIGEKIQIPIIRACPNCLTLLSHVAQCKHMKCPRKDCGTEFCFSCLKLKDSVKGWSCAGAYDQCKVAERQKIK